MQRAMLICAVLAVLGAAPAAAGSQFYFGFKVEIGDAPPPPRVSHRGALHLAMVPDLEVYVVTNRDLDYDVFRYGRFWYMCDGGYWYRAKRYRGPYALISVRAVPSPIFYVPRERWRHHKWGPKWIRHKGHEAERRGAWVRARHAKHRGHEVHKASARKHEQRHAKTKEKRATAKKKVKDGKSKQIATNDQDEPKKDKRRSGRDRR